MTTFLAQQLADIPLAFLPTGGEGFAEALAVGAATIYGSLQTESAEGGELEGPRAWVSDADVTAQSITHGTAITARAASLSYTVEGLRPDGHGMTLLILK